MTNSSEIFEKHYQDYCAQIAGIDFAAVQDSLGIRQEGDRLCIPFFNQIYAVSKDGILDASGSRPPYMVCVVLAKYVLLCPERAHLDPQWTSFKDFKRTSHFLNVKFFTSDTETAIARHFSGRLEELAAVCSELGGLRQEAQTSYDLAVQFDALPRISLLLLFNDADEEFPAQCKVLFQKHAEFYLDPESLAMTGAFLAQSLKRTS